MYTHMVRIKWVIARKQLDIQVLVSKPATKSWCDISLEPRRCTLVHYCLMQTRRVLAAHTHTLTTTPSTHTPQHPVHTHHNTLYTLTTTSCTHSPQHPVHTHHNTLYTLTPTPCTHTLTPTHSPQHPVHTHHNTLYTLTTTPVHTTTPCTHTHSPQNSLSMVSQLCVGGIELVHKCTVSRYLLNEFKSETNVTTFLSFSFQNHIWFCLLSCTN